ncbi:MAG: lamin tail domain-containing protein [bacterium]
MRRVLIIISVFFGGFFVARDVWATIAINEIGAYEKSGYEWVEIVNVGNQPVDLTGWKFWEAEVDHKLKDGQPDSLVEPGEYAVICQDDIKFRTAYPVFTGSIFDSSWSSLKETGEEIGLKNNQGDFVERFTYLPARSYSLERKDRLIDNYSLNNWQEHQNGNTVGYINSRSKIVNSPKIFSTSSAPVKKEADSPRSPQVLVEESIKALITTSSEQTVSSTKEIIAKEEDIKEDLEIQKSISKSEKVFISQNLWQARNLNVGDKLKAGGIVSVLPGIFGAQYFYITDDFSGIQVYMYKKDFPELALGDLVQVGGEISKSLGVKRIKVKDKQDIKILQRGNKIKIVSSSMDNLNERYIGSLVQVAGMITEIKSSYLYIDDGNDEVEVYLKKGVGINKKIFEKGHIIQMAGILEVSTNGLRLMPRSIEDIKIQKQEQEKNAVSNQNQPNTSTVFIQPKQQAEKYLAVAVGGISLVLAGFLVWTKKIKSA